jgi:hypothetical protein
METCEELTKEELEAAGARIYTWDKLQGLGINMLAFEMGVRCEWLSYVVFILNKFGISFDPAGETLTYEPSEQLFKFEYIAIYEDSAITPS